MYVISINIVTPPKVGMSQIVGKGGTTNQNNFCTVFYSTNNFQSFIYMSQQFTQSETFSPVLPVRFLVASRNDSARTSSLLQGPLLCSCSGLVLLSWRAL